jgi:hypothetical protein
MRGQLVTMDITAQLASYAQMEYVRKEKKGIVLGGQLTLANVFMCLMETTLRMTTIYLLLYAMRMLTNVLDQQKIG